MPATTAKCSSPARRSATPPTPVRSSWVAPSASVAERRQLARVHDPRRVELGLDGSERREASLADLLAHPRRMIAPDGVMVGDRAATGDDRPARRLLDGGPLRDRILLLLARDQREVERRAGLIEMRDVTHHEARRAARAQRVADRAAD